jgi:uncharacterized protein YjbI with pentapeptide repeats
MNPSKRQILFAAAVLAAAASRSPQHRRGISRVCQYELDEAIRLHSMWLADMNTGQRCSFAGRDLSGLSFGISGGGPVDLNSADFTQADLSETRADDILVHRCSFNGATLDRCRWLRPVFAYADMRRISAKNVQWGSRGSRGSAERSPADFSHAALHDADLSHAQLCGYFYGTKLRSASLVQADLSLSDFLGPRHYEMSFSGARLTSARLRDCKISSVSFFDADCSEADFSGSTFSDVRTKGCNLSGARLQGAKIERTPFSADQLRGADFRDATIATPPSA